MSSPAKIRSPAKTIILLFAGLLITLVLTVVALFSISDWNRARPWINRTVSSAVERPFAINGDLRLTWVRNVDSLHWWLPRPRISAANVFIGNPADGPAWKSKRLGTIQTITAVLNPLPLFRGVVAVLLLDIEGAQISLERKLNDKNNWTFSASAAQKPSRWRFAPAVLRIHKSTLQLDDVQRQLSLRAEADSYDKGIHWQVTGIMNQAPLQGHGSAGSILALQDTTTPYPLTFVLDVGTTHISAVGTLTNPTQLAAVDVNLKLSGASMAHLYPLTNILLPETSAFATQGHLVGKLSDNKYGGKWRYENFRGVVGASDLSGHVVYEAAAIRPMITAELVSQSLNFSDLAPLIGADSNANKARRHAETFQPENKVLPIEPFKTDRWSSIDAKVKFDGKKIIREQSLPIDNLHAEVALQDGVLKLTPINFGVAGGQLAANMHLDGRKNPLQAEMEIAPRHIKLKELFPAAESMKASLGEINGSAALTATGNSIAALLGSADGEVKLFVDRGTVSKFILEAAGLNIANVVATKLFGDRQVNLTCAAANFKVDSGVMNTQGFIVDTDTALINVSGNISMAEEKFALTVKPESKGLRMLSLRAPLYVKGTFKDPDISIDKGVVALRGGGALALGAVAWPAALLPLVANGEANASSDRHSEALPADNGCVQLLSQTKQKAVTLR